MGAHGRPRRQILAKEIHVCAGLVLLARQLLAPDQASGTDENENEREIGWRPICLPLPVSVTRNQAPSDADQ